MRRAIFSLLLLAGCADTGGAPSGMRDDLFVAREVRLHPVFTHVADWTGDGKADGIEALVELHDQFGDTTKGAGTFTFELFEFRRDQPDPRGERVSQPWIADVITADQQRARWSKTSRCYTFRLQSDKGAHGGVLSVTFTPVSGPRAFDKVVLVNHLIPSTQEAPPDNAPLSLPGEAHPLNDLPAAGSPITGENRGSGATESDRINGSSGR